MVQRLIGNTLTLFSMVRKGSTSSYRSIIEYNNNTLILLLLYIFFIIFFIIIISSSSSSSSKHNRDHSSNAKYSGWDSIFSMYFRMVCSSSHSGLLPAASIHNIAMQPRGTFALRKGFSAK